MPINSLKEIMQNNVFDTLPADSSARSNYAVVLDSMPDITPLPFGPKVRNVDGFYKNRFDNRFYSELIKNHTCFSKIGSPDPVIYTPSYALPPVKKFTYIPLDGRKEHLCDFDIPIDSLFRINKYKKRLPDIGTYQVYYMCGECEGVYHVYESLSSVDFPKLFLQYCGNAMKINVPSYYKYGFLILYTPDKKEAKILFIYHLEYGESGTEYEKVFYIDTDYTINILEKYRHDCNSYIVEDGENYTINILNSGEIEIKKIDILSPETSTLTQAELKEIMMDNIFDYCIDSTIVLDSKHSVTPLPFGPEIKSLDDFYKDEFDDNRLFYEDMITLSGDNSPVLYTPTYVLPPVKKFTYINLNPEWDCLCDYNIPIDSLFKINKYKKRLPNIGHYQIYYMCNDNSYWLHNDFPVQFFKYCHQLPIIEIFGENYDVACTDGMHSLAKYGYLILYNPKNQEAKILLIYSYIDTWDRVYYRKFYVDVNYAINIVERTFKDNNDYESEGYGQSEVIDRVFKINILKNGEIEVKEKELYDMWLENDE